MIKSINYSQKDILRDIMSLYKIDRIDIDFTFSKGNFYKEIQEPIYKFDKFPLNSSIQKLEFPLPINGDSLNSCIIDLPFVITYGPSIGENNKTNIEGSNIIANRFSGFRNWEELKKCYRENINEAYRILKPNGILVFKTQDQISSGKQYLTSYFSTKSAIEVGFSPLDVFVLCSKNRLVSGKWKTQHHARKHHSYFLVFKKEKCVNYD